MNLLDDGGGLDHDRLDRHVSVHAAVGGLDTALILSTTSVPLTTLPNTA